MPWTREQLEAICNEGKKNNRPAQFRGLKLHGVDFSGMDLEKADFRSAACPYANFENTNCKMLNAEGANFTMTKWAGSNLHRANLKDATLSDADMRGVKDFFGVTITLECRTWQGVKLDPGFWYGWLFYGLLMEPPTEELKEKLQLFFGEERFTTLKNLYAHRRM
jgi:hypothetical protein